MKRSAARRTSEELETEIQLIYLGSSAYNNADDYLLADYNHQTNVDRVLVT